MQFDVAKTTHLELTAKSKTLKQMMVDVGAPPPVKPSNTSRFVSSTGTTAPSEPKLSLRTLATSLSYTGRRTDDGDGNMVAPPSGNPAEARALLEGANQLALVELNVPPETADLLPVPKSHELRTAQALWDTGGAPMDFQEFRKTFALKQAFGSLHARPDAGGASDEDDGSDGDNESGPDSRCCTPVIAFARD